MMFDIPILSEYIFSLVVFHGAIDIMRPFPHLLLYTFAIFPMNNNVTTFFFFLSSIIHFKNDISFIGSVCLHSLTLSIASIDFRVASFIMLAYMVCVHIPMLFITFFEKEMYTHIFVLICLFGFGLGTVHFRKFPYKHTFPLDYKMQRVVIAHVLVNEFFPFLNSNILNMKQKPLDVFMRF